MKNTVLTKATPFRKFINTFRKMACTELLTMITKLRLVFPLLQMINTVLMMVFPLRKIINTFLKLVYPLLKMMCPILKMTFPSRKHKLHFLKIVSFSFALLCFKFQFSIRMNSYNFCLETFGVSFIGL